MLFLNFGAIMVKLVSEIQFWLYWSIYHHLPLLLFYYYYYYYN